MRHAPVLVERADREARDLVAPEPVVEQDSQEGPVATRLEALPLRSAEEPPCLGIGERRCPAFIRVLHPGPPDARDGILMDGVLVTEVAEERGDGRELPPPGRRTETALLEHLPPGDDVGPADEPELAEAADPEHRHELPHVAPVRAPGVRVVDVGEPLGRRRHVGQLLELGRRDQPAADVAPDRQFSRRLGRDRGVQLGRVHAAILLPIMYFINSNEEETHQSATVPTEPSLMEWTPPDPRRQNGPGRKSARRVRSPHPAHIGARWGASTPSLRGVETPVGRFPSGCWLPSLYRLQAAASGIPRLKSTSRLSGPA